MSKSLDQPVFVGVLTSGDRDCVVWLHSSLPHFQASNTNFKKLRVHSPQPSRRHLFHILSQELQARGPLLPLFLHRVDVEEVVHLTGRLGTKKGPWGIHWNPCDSQPPMLQHRSSELKMSRVHMSRRRCQVIINCRDKPKSQIDGIYYIYIINIQCIYIYPIVSHWTPLRSPDRHKMVKTHESLIMLSPITFKFPLYTSPLYTRYMDPFARIIVTPWYIQCIHTHNHTYCLYIIYIYIYVCACMFPMHQINISNKFIEHPTNP